MIDSSPNPLAADGLRVRPSIAIGLAVFAMYIAVMSPWWFLDDTDFEDIASTVDTIRNNIVLTIGLAGAATAIAVTLLGWWRPILTERRVGRAWMWLAPVALVGGMAIQAAQTDWGVDKFTTEYFAWLALGMLVVGFSEELLFRGVLLVGARRSLTEGWVVVFTSALFGVFHFVNLATGQSFGNTVAQAIGAGFSGVVFYLARRLSGTILVGMALHGASDFFALALGESDAEASAAGVGDVVAMIIAIIAVVKLIRHDRGRPTTEGAAA